ncbi:MAG TPA: hypothetical protein VFR78_02585 [Pyrinomonadaceae bacterium]|nr:hypothetical protein [Pyrinomonadaceae bacterium]
MRLIFLSLPSSEIAIARVAARVAQGGHNSLFDETRMTRIDPCSSAASVGPLIRNLCRRDPQPASATALLLT